MGLLAQVTISLNVPSSPGAPGFGLPRTGVAIASTIVLACAFLTAGLLALAMSRANKRQQGDTA